MWKRRRREPLTKADLEPLRESLRGLLRAVRAERARGDGLSEALSMERKYWHGLLQQERKRRRTMGMPTDDEWIGDLEERLQELERDCADLAEDVFSQAFQDHGDGKGGIHPALRHKFLRDIDTARKYLPTERLADAGVTDGDETP